jgi:hypothetical protein
MPTKTAKKKVVKKAATKKSVKKKAAVLLSNLTEVVAPAKKPPGSKKKVTPTKLYRPPADTLNLYKNSWFLIVSFGKPGNLCLVKSEDVEVRHRDAPEKKPAETKPTKKGAKKVAAVQVGTEETDVDQNMLRVQKQLLDSPELEAVGKFDSRCRALVKKFTLKSAFDGTGIYLIPRALAEKAREFLAQEKTERDALVEAFLAVYPARIEEAKDRLKEFFDATRYDSPEAVRRKFKMSWCLRTIDMAQDIKSLGSAVEEEERAKFNSELQDLHTEIAGSLRLGLKTALDRIIYALTPTEDGKRRRLETSNVKSLMEFVEFFGAKNIVGDADCEALVEQVKALLGDKDLDYLMFQLAKKDKANETNDFREQMLAGFSKIAEQTEELVIEDESRIVGI